MTQQFKLQKKVEGQWIDLVRKDGLEGVNRFKTAEAARDEGLVILTQKDNNSGFTFRVVPITEEKA